MKKLLAIILIFIFFIPISVYGERQLDKHPRLKKYQYSYNLEVLSKELYPEIYKRIADYKITDPFTQENAQGLVDTIALFINLYHDKEKLKFVSEPEIAMLGEEVEDKLVSYISVKLYLVEADLKANMTSVFIATKIFYVGNLPKIKQNTIPTKKMGSTI